MEMNFCRRCGKELIRQTANGHHFKCENDHDIFNNPAPTSGVFFVEADNRHALLSVRGIEPSKGMLDAFGGFVENSEGLEEALEREMREELGLGPEHYERPRYLVSAPSTYPYGGDTYTLVTTLFWSRLNEGAQPKAQDDVAAIRRIDIHDETVLDEAHGDDIRQGILALRRLFPVKLDTRKEDR